MAENYPCVLWVADGPMVASGYGNQTALACSEFKKNDVPVGIIARGGIDEHIPIWNGIPCFPRLGHPYAYEIIAARMRDIDADVCVTLHDLVAATPRLVVDRGVRWAPWAPIDTEPISPVTLGKLGMAWDPMTFSHYGVKAAKEKGLDVSYIPHMVETDVYKPGDKKVARREHFEGRVSGGEFLFTMIAANKSGNMNRKGIVPALQAFARIAKSRDDVHLYLHTMKEPLRQEALDLTPICDLLEIPHERITFAEPMRLVAGEYDPVMMASIYQASDCVLAPGTMEGFCLPIVEAHACGVPCVIGNWQAMRDHVELGFDQPIKVGDSEKFWNDGLRSFLQLVHVDSLEKAMLRAIEDQPRKVAKNRVAKETRDKFNPPTVFENYWKPKLLEWRERIDQEGKVDTDEFVIGQDDN